MGCVMVVYVIPEIQGAVIFYIPKIAEVVAIGIIPKTISVYILCLQIFSQLSLSYP